MNKNIILFILLLWSVLGVSAKPEYPVSDIPDSLKSNAHAVIRSFQTEFQYFSAESGVQKVCYVATIFESEGRDLSDFVCYTDHFRELKSFSGEVYGADGNVLKKIRKSDLGFNGLSANLISDDQVYFYECRTGGYPYTVKYEYEVKLTNGMISFPGFHPLWSFNTSLVEAGYKLVIPDGVKFKYRNANMISEPEKSSVTGSTSYSWSVKGLKAVEPEVFSPSFSRLFPNMYLTPMDFVFEKTRGDMSDWSRYGLWQQGLQTGRDEIPEDLKLKLKEMTAQAESVREKVRIVYDYLAATTRYVSIQLGIGGLQPMPAMQVYKTGFGDCKGLSNYMRAMLSSLGIASNYTEISTVNKRMIPDFASAGQSNHAILQVPLQSDTIWLECTNAQLPFGYVHDDIAGHDALVITSEGGRLCRLKSYPDSINLSCNRVNIVLGEAGKAVAEVRTNAFLSRYESLFGFQKMESAKQTDYLRRRITLSQAQVSDIKITESKSEIPEMEISYRVDADAFGNRSGKRLFIPINVFRTGMQILNKKHREHPLCVNMGYIDKDTITFQLPEGYQIESLPRPVQIDSDFGRFSSEVVASGRQVTVIQQLYFPSGEYGAEKYNALNDFCDRMSAAYKSTIVLKTE